MSVATGVRDQARRSLRTLRGESASAMRCAVLEQLGRVVPCDHWMTYGLAEVEGTVRYTGLGLLCDDDGARSAYQRLDGRESFPKRWTPTRPPRDENNHFVVMPADELDCYPQWDAFYRPFEFYVQCRVLLYDGPRFVGWLGGMRSGQGECFSDGEVAALENLVPDLTRAMSACSVLETGVLPRTPSHAFLSASGRLRHADASMVEWLDRARMGRLEDLVRRCERDSAAARRVVVDGAVLDITHLDGPEGRAYLVTARSAVSPRLAPDALLTPRQREIAQYAAVGATIEEIAATVSISPNTVKSHLKRVYEALGVANRVELAAALGVAS